MKQRARLALYSSMLLAFAAAAVLRLTGQFIPTPFGCGGGWLCSFGDPIGTALMTSRTGSGPIRLLQEAYYQLHAPLLFSVLILALCAVRAHALWRTRGASLPPQFAGFPLGIASLGALVYVLDTRMWVLVPFPLLEPPRVYAAICMLLALLLTEGSALLARRRGAHAPALAGEGVLPAATVTAAAAPAEPARRRPVWTVIAISSPVVGVLLVLLLFAAVAGADGFTGMAAMFLGILAFGLSLALGAVATVIAVARRERWPALQVLAFLVNFGVGVPLLLRFQ
jgi:energy-converting hydrogenase Eha subunit E